MKVTSNYLLDVLWRSLLSSFDAIGETLGSVLWLIACLAVVGAYRYFRRGRAAFSDHLKEVFSDASIVAFLLGGIVFLYQLSNTILLDHQKLESDKQNSGAEVVSLQSKVAELDKQLKEKSDALNRKEPEGEQKKCWQYDNQVFPNPYLVREKGATHAIQVVMFCNYKLVAPIYAAAEFDNEFVEGTVYALGVGTMTAGERRVGAKGIEANIGSPNIRAYQPVMFLIHAKSPIRTVGYALRSLD